MKRLSSAVAIAIVVAVGSAAVIRSVQAQTPAAWIRANAISLTTVEPGHGFADMQPLKKLIGDARIVSLGEATHGTREFFQLKHRMLEFLASEMGFTIFSIEASMPEAYRLNDYVLEGKGDPAQLLRGMYFWTWDTEEVLAMIRWMREFNQSRKGRVEFTGFDMQTATVAQQQVRDFVARYDADYATALATAAQAAARAAAAPAGSATNFGVVSAPLPSAAVAGRKVRFSGFIRTEGMTRGYAGLWFRASGASGVVAFDNMGNRGATGTSDWKQYTIDLDVPANITSVVFGALMPGDGKAWFDNFALEIDGKPYADSSPFDFDFEGPALKTFVAGGASYRAEIDRSIAQNGRQSLRLDGPGAGPPAQPAVDVRGVVTEYQGVVARLDSNRARYRAGGAPDRDVDWAIQNARIVLQGLQMRAGLVSRDRSMADNVKWIADRQPGAKIVLWAHNAHVATSGFGFETMGAALRRMYGPSMVVMGFSFGQGSFQAMPQGGGALKAFTVPLLPADSLDAMLASAGLPVFALDLRNAPAWLREPRSARQIGAAYPDGSPDAFAMKIPAADAFDMLLFVNTTSAARANPR